MSSYTSPDRAADRPLPTSNHRDSNLTSHHDDFSLTGMHQESLSNVRQVASALAHATRNPLNALKGAVYYLKGKYGEDPKISEFLQIASHEITRIENAISEFLTIYAEHPTMKQSDINSLLKRLLVLTDYQMKLNNIKLFTNYGQIQPSHFNPFEIGQAILNVLNNAIDAMQNGGSLSVVTSLEHHFGKAHIVSTVSDTGPGLSRSMEGNIPDDNADKGYGLAITRDILKRQDGRLSIISNEGRGTSVTIYFPYLQRTY